MGILVLLRSIVKLFLSFNMCTDIELYLSTITIVFYSVSGLHRCLGEMGLTFDSPEPYLMVSRCLYIKLTV